MLDMYEKPETRAVMIDTTDAARLDMKYEAGIKVHQGRELIMHEEPETRAVMVDTTKAVRLNMKYETGIKAHQGRELIMHKEPETRDGTINKYGKLELRAVIVDISDAVMLDMV
jgi:hypothetical protein